MQLTKEVWITLALLSASVLAMAALYGLEKKARTQLNPSLIPTTPLFLVAGLVAILAIVHLLNLAGIQTGR